jgi:hypothetical protein
MGGAMSEAATVGLCSDGHTLDTLFYEVECFSIIHFLSCSFELTETKRFYNVVVDERNAGLSKAVVRGVDI